MGPETWKVGDRLTWNGLEPHPGAPSHRAVGMVVMVTKLIAGNMELSDGSLWDLAYWKPVTRFWTLAPRPQLPSYRVGDRVRRTDHAATVKVPAGKLGSIYSIDMHEIAVTWDGLSDPYIIYRWPEDAEYFTPHTCVTPKPVLCCIRCGEFNEYAEPNQPDGTHRCWQCKQDRYR